MLTPKQKKNFWAKVQRGSRDSCWPWLGYKEADGRGTFRVGKNKYKAPRVMWLEECGEIPAGILVCHRCDNPACMNPNHLWLGTPKDNMLDMVVKGRYGSKNGHSQETKAKMSAASSLRKRRPDGTFERAA